MTNAANIDESLRGDVPEWAKRRVHDLTYQNVPAIGSFTEQVQDAFARYIMAHEEAPVDPLWAEAMAFTEGRGWNGSSPILPMVKFAHAAMQRGIEIAGDRA